MIDVENALNELYPDFPRRHPRLTRALLPLLRIASKEKALKEFEQGREDVEGFDFVEQVLEYLDFHYAVRDDEKQRIPPSGRVVIIANHPIGTLDGLALLKLIREVRPDVKVVANNVLYMLEPLRSVLLPVDNMGGNTSRGNLRAIQKYLENEGAVIFFPSGEVSRIRPQGVRDPSWNRGFLSIAQSTKSPILPIHVDGRNSRFFYSVSMVAKPLSTLLLIREMFKQKNKVIDFNIGEFISYETYQQLSIPNSEKVRLLKRHLYRVGDRRKGIFATETPIAHPEDRRALKNELKNSQLLGKTGDGKLIYLFDYHPDSIIMREVGRLREISFRAVGEGTGRKRDVDSYDRHYLQLILWDEDDLEIVGAYRFCDATQCADSLGKKHLYSDLFFHYTEEMRPYLEQGLELGRSFVQPKYWGRRSLEYLWYGIGAFLRANPQFRYLFGPVTLSNAYPQWALDNLVYFYGTHYPCTGNLVSPEIPYTISKERLEELKDKFPGKDPQEEFVQLKSELAFADLNVPTLYKQYSDLCEPGGVQFAGFNIDPDFANCVDGLIIVDMDKFKASKRERYIEERKEKS